VVPIRYDESVPILTVLTPLDQGEGLRDGRWFLDVGFPHQGLGAHQDRNDDPLVGQWSVNLSDGFLLNVLGQPSTGVQFLIENRPLLN
jgi:hypothetical protein